MIIKSVASTSGYGSGKAFRLCRGNSAGAHVMSIDEAFKAERERLKALSVDNDIFAAHLEILDDPTLSDAIEEHLAGGENPLEAVASACDDIVSMFSSIDDEYLRARVDDVKDVCRNIESRLAGNFSGSLDIPEGSVVVADEIFPSDTSRMDLSKVSAFVTRKGSVTSHVCIIATSRGIPVALGVDIDMIADGDNLIVNGNTGEVAVNPTEDELSKLAESRIVKDRESEIIQEPVEYQGHIVNVYGNAGSVEDVAKAMAAGADGIGLFRTEFVFMRSEEFPTEEEQFEIYRDAALLCGDKPLTIRTMDIGGDKKMPYLSIEPEDNPFLGVRGVRLCLANPGLFKIQLRAILRAGSFGNVRILVPMVTTSAEIDRVRALIEECKAELSAEGKEFGSSIPLGAMVETPASVFAGRTIAEKVEFFSIGTNDLTQYIMAADRGNSGVSILYNPKDIAVKNAVEVVVSNAHEAGIKAGICGEAASDPEFAEFLLEAGIDSLSLSDPRMIPVTKKLIRR